MAESMAGLLEAAGQELNQICQVLPADGIEIDLDALAFVIPAQRQVYFASVPINE